MNLRPSGYEPDELPGCSTPRWAWGWGGRAVWLGFGWVVCAGSGGPGGDLLSRGLSRSTIGAEGFHGRVRDGIGCWGPRHGHQAVGGQRRVWNVLGFRSSGGTSARRRPSGPEGARRCAWRDQANRAISTGPLHASLRLHVRPIDVMVCHGSRARPGFEGGFPLRCLQRLSRPHIATRLRGWRHDRSTRGASIPVLSY